MNQKHTTLCSRSVLQPLLLCTLKGVLVMMFLLAGVPRAHAENLPQKTFAHPERIRYDGSCMTIDGHDTFIYSAAFHYFRCPEALWRDRFAKIKEAGFNTVETYVPWNWHERTMPADRNDQSHFDFADLRRWLRMAQEEFGFYTIVRPGPFICAEFSGGAYPRWLARFRPEQTDGFWLRSADNTHVAWCVHWFDAVCKELAPEQITRKKAGEKGIIMIQIENEYDAHGTSNKERFLKELYRSVRRSMDIPVFTCLTSQCRGSKDGELSQVFDCDNYYVGLNDAPSCAHRMMNLRRAQPDAPGFVTELQGGWFSLQTGTLSDQHYSDARHFRAIGLMTMLGGGTGINYYMLFGGTHLEGWGARGMTTSYDYNAAIRENGSVGNKYLEAKAIGEFIRTYESSLVRTTGGPCELQGASDKIFGGLRVAADGTRFVFLHNTDDKRPSSGQVTLLPGRISRPSAPMYNINQHGQKVLIEAGGDSQSDSMVVEPLTLDYELGPLGASVLVIPPGKSPSEGEWWPRRQPAVRRPAQLPAPVRVASVWRREDIPSRAEWIPTHRLLSLSELDVNDFRYSLYRSRFTLSREEAAQLRYLLFNMYTRDIVSVSVNGRPAKRLFPDRADAQSWTTRDCFSRIRPDEYDNQFAVDSLLRKGDNEIVVVYENLGHAHGYFSPWRSWRVFVRAVCPFPALLSHVLCNGMWPRMWPV